MNWRSLLYAAGGGLIVGYLLHRPAERVEVKTQIKEVTVWKVAEQIKALPGSTTTLKPDGSTTITGPVEIGRTLEGSTSRSVDSHTQIESRSAMALAAGVLLPRSAFSLGMDYYANGWLGAGVQAEFPIGSYLPNRGGVRLIVKF